MDKKVEYSFIQQQNQMEVERQFSVISENWDNSKHGLFDFYHKQKDQFRLEKTSSHSQGLKVYRDIVRGVNFCIKQPFELRDNYEYVCDIRLKEEYSEVWQKFHDVLSLSYEPPRKQLQFRDKPAKNCSYLSVKGLNIINSDEIIEGFCLEIGSIIKAGLLNFKVVELKRSKSAVRQYEQPLPCEKYYEKEMNPENNEEQKQKCRICFQNKGKQSFELTCFCKGTVKTVHFKCFFSWANKFQKRTPGKKTQSFKYTFQYGHCDVCKSPLQKRVLVNQKQIDLFKFQKPRKAHIILERLSEKKGGMKEFYVVIPKQNEEVTFGRLPQNNFHLQNFTISKIHFSLMLKNEKFYVKDLGSRFGTLIRLDKNVQLDGSKFNVQINSTNYTFQTKESEDSEREVCQDWDRYNFE